MNVNGRRILAAAKEKSPPYRHRWVNRIDGCRDDVWGTSNGRRLSVHDRYRERTARLIVHGVLNRADHRRRTFRERGTRWRNAGRRAYSGTVVAHAILPPCFAASFAEPLAKRDLASN